MKINLKIISGMIIKITHKMACMSKKQISILQVQTTIGHFMDLDFKMILELNQAQ
jgi:hypothetical protein